VPERLSNETIDQYYARLGERSDQEDLVMFINACFAATDQNDYYTDRYQQSITIGFLHQYVMANFRCLYARVLAAGINHFNQALILFNLLQSGAPASTDERAEEGQLVFRTLQLLPANRVYRLFRQLQKRRVNNRRTRAVIKRYLSWRPQPTFDAIKYRTKFRSAIAHAHINIDEQLGDFLFEFGKRGSYRDELLDQFRAAWYSATAVYQLPFTVAESLAVKHKIPRDVFLAKIQHKMTAAEKLRYQSAADRTKGVRLDYNLQNAPLTKLALYVLSLSWEERKKRCEELDSAFKESAARALRSSQMELGKVAVILDASRSAGGSREKKNRPLAVALAATYLLRSAAAQTREFLIPQTKAKTAEYPFLVSAAGQTAIADAVIDALAWKPDLLLVISDGFENDPPGGTEQILRLYNQHLAPDKSPTMVHLNPVFDAAHYEPRQLAPSMPTVGLRDAEDIQTMLGFAKFADGTVRLKELEEYLALRMIAFFRGQDGE